MSESLRDQIIQVLLATRAMSEGVVADAIIAALTQQEAEPVASVIVRENETSATYRYLTHVDAASCLPIGKTDLYPHPPKPAALPQPVASEIPCARCGGECVEFTVPNAIWNTVIRPDGEERDDEYLCIDCWHLALEEHLLKPVASVPQDKEKLAQWMLSRSIATGHGDTIDDLIKELNSQVVVKSVPKSDDEWIAAHKQDVEISYHRFTEVVSTFDLRTFLSQRDAGFVRVPVEKIASALKDLQHLHGDIRFRSKMAEGYQEGVVFIGASAWKGLNDTIALLTASKEGV